MDIVRLVEKKILLVAEKIIAVLGEGTSYTNFEMELKKELDGLGCEILGTVLEALEEKTFGSEDRKHDWKNGTMVQRWLSAALLDAERRAHRIQGYRSMSVLVVEIKRLTIDLEMGDAEKVSNIA